MGDRSTHPLDSLLRPASIAVLGASEREHTVGSQVVENLLQGGFKGALYPVNPNRESVFGLRAYPHLSALPEPVEQVIFAVADSRVESALHDTIAHGARSAVIYSSLVLENDSTPHLRARVADKVRRSGLILCGANGMGYYNFHDGIWACGFDTRSNHVRGGNVTLISHSGAGMSGIIDCEERIDFNLVVSTGQELSVTMDQYMDYAIEQMNTRVIGLFMETTRNPAGLVAVLEKAAQRHIPVVALKVGRTALAAQLALSHCGSMAGQDAAYQALFDRYGVQRVEDMDELATSLIMFAQPHPVGSGGLVTLHDSGGERQLLIDLADTVGANLTRVSATTRDKLVSLLDPGLEPVNPLDAWSQGGPGADKVMEQCMATLMCDEQAAFGAVVHDRAPHGNIYEEYIDYMRVGHAASGKPVFLVANRQGIGSDSQVHAATREGLPVLDGVRSFLVGARCLMAYRDFQLALGSPDTHPFKASLPVEMDSIAEPWRTRLQQQDFLDEYDSAQLLADFGIPVNEARRVTDLDAAVHAATDLNYPVVLKSAQPGLQHKTDQGGVVLNLQNEAQLRAAYTEMAERLGPLMLISHMVTEPGVEMMLGMVRDEQFGPLVMMGFGGIYIESIKDVVWALPPFNGATARRLLKQLKQRRLLDGQRGHPAMNIDSYCAAAARFSCLAAALSDVVAEIDINPVKIHAGGCLALDALVVSRHKADNTSKEDSCESSLKIEKTERSTA